VRCVRSRARTQGSDGRSWRFNHDGGNGNHKIPCRFRLIYCSRCGFILETQFAAYLTPGAYLSSVVVLSGVMEEMGKAGINDVVVVAYPGHSFRAAALTAAVAHKKNLRLIVHVADTTGVKTEPGAQDWTDSFWSYDLISRGALLEWAIIEMERGLHRT
jgi:hypothetical protein